MIIALPSSEKASTTPRLHQNITRNSVLGSGLGPISVVLFSIIVSVGIIRVSRGVKSGEKRAYTSWLQLVIFYERKHEKLHMRSFGKTTTTRCVKRHHLSGGSYLSRQRQPTQLAMVLPDTTFLSWFV
jgi:hypothetical protein